MAIFNESNPESYRSIYGSLFSEFWGKTSRKKGASGSRLSNNNSSNNDSITESLKGICQSAQIAEKKGKRCSMVLSKEHEGQVQGRKYRTLCIYIYDKSTFVQKKVYFLTNYTN